MVIRLVNRLESQVKREMEDAKWLMKIPNVKPFIDDIDNLAKKIEEHKNYLLIFFGSEGEYQVSHVKGQIEDIGEWLKRAALRRIISLMLQENLSNSGVTVENLIGALDEKDIKSFNFEKAINLVRELEKDAAKLSIEAIIQEARQLLPYLIGKDGCWGPARSREEILDDHEITLRGFTWDSLWKRVSFNADRCFRQVAALDKLTKIVFAKIDPRTVTSDAEARLFTTREDLYAGGRQFRYFVVRFFKNDKIKVRFITEAQAETIADVLVGALKLGEEFLKGLEAEGLGD